MSLPKTAPSKKTGKYSLTKPTIFSMKKRRILRDALRATGGRVAEAAARIGMGRATLYKKIAALGIDI